MHTPPLQGVHQDGLSPTQPLELLIRLPKCRAEGFIHSSTRLVCLAMQAVEWNGLVNVTDT